MVHNKKYIDDKILIEHTEQPIELVLCGNTAHLKSSNLTNNTTRIIKVDEFTYVKGKNLATMTANDIQAYINKSAELGCTFNERFNGDIDINGYLGTITLCHFDKKEKRTDDERSILRSVGELRDIINTNVLNGSFCRFITLTYKDNMQDSKKLYNDFENFNKRMRSYHLECNLPPYEYIAVKEPQKRGAWHLHVLFIYQVKAPFIANSVIADNWKKGFTKITKVDDVDNVGAYLSAYLCNDAEVDEQQNAHKIEKGKRLSYYKKGERFYSYSKGIKKPTTTKMLHADAISYLFSNNYHLTFQKEREININDIDIKILTQYFQK